MSESVDAAALETLFYQGRTFHSWQDRPVAEETLHRFYDLMKWGPTSANCTPARLVFITTPEARERLRPHLMEGNVEQTMTAPCCVIVAQDMQFYEELPRLFPAKDMRKMFEGNDELIRTTALRNASLQGGYLILAARALGLDCGPMSGFNNGSLDEAFFPDGRWKSNFLCNVGYGRREDLYPRSPRLAFDEACRIL